MRLVRARIQRLPGIEDPFTVEGFGAGATLVIGPNGVGKSSLARLVRLALWPEPKRLAGTLATLVFERDGARWEAEVADGKVSWRRDGEPSDPPPLPDARAARAARLGLVELVRAGPVREWMYGVLVGLAAVDGLDPAESELLDWLRDAWALA